MTTHSERTWALAAHLASLAAGGLYLVRVNRTQWFFGDEWEFLGGARRALPWYDQYLAPHNEHWSTSPYAIYRLLESLFGIRSYWPYILTAIFIHLVVVHLVWRVTVQGRVSPWIATVSALPLIVLGAGAQNLLWAFQIGFLGSVALGLRGDSPRESRRRRLAVTGLGGAGARALCVVVVGGRRADGRHLHARHRPEARNPARRRVRGRAGGRVCGLGHRVPAAHQSGGAVAPRVRGRRVAVRRDRARHGGRCVRLRPPVARLAAARRSRRLSRPHGIARANRGSRGIRVRTGSGGPIPSLCLRTAEARDGAGRRDAVRLISRSCSWFRPWRWSPTGCSRDGT